MSNFKASIWLAFMIAICLGSRLAGASEPSHPQPTPIVADVMNAPHAVLGSDRRVHLVYEVRIANTTSKRITLKRVAIVANQAGAELATMGTEEIGRRLSLGGRRGNESTDLGPSQFGVLFVHVTLERDAPVPARLAHRIDGTIEQPTSDFSIRVAESSVITAAPPTLGAPLRGHGYVAGDGCCDSIRHVRALLPLDGTYYLAQRYAIDWEQIDKDNRLFRGDPKDVRSYHIYGRPVIAVTDATVVATRNDLPDQVPGKLPDGLPIDEADGNFAILDIGSGAFALYAHMRPGSVRVKTGDRIRRGDHIGDVGNSGNTQAPHLHFQVMDAPSSLVSNGIPYVFDIFSITAVDEAGTADFDRAEESGTPLTLTPRVPPAAFEKTLPLDLSVVDWRN